MSTTSLESQCFYVDRNDESVSRSIDIKSMDHWPAGEVIIEVEYSSLNFKDALAASGNPGVARSLPLVPGIDAVGVVKSCDTESLCVGDRVYVAHPDFGTAAWGGWSKHVRVPRSWVHLLPKEIDPQSFIIYGTAGFTAAQCVAALQFHGITPGDGPIVISGATGGVGIFAVKLLGQLGYDVVASTGKKERTDWLLENGASSVIGRDEINDTGGRPLLSGSWAGAVDTVGGNTLATIIRASKIGACITACGVVGGAELPLTVYPFILRGVTLCGIDSANVCDQTRHEIWTKLSNQWKVKDLDLLATEVSLEGLNEYVELILKGQVAGRVVVKM